ncbi:MAG: phospholipid carrier-dependent glycosyltransferase [Chloroflexi bacterium]|nr:phospholipid carrier-dependent glycosyltransferase [Chloroflexota bacterium]
MSRFDRLSLLAVTALAALLRLPGIDARGTFDADQGHDMATLLAFTRDGVVPLLGPKTSVGDFHHGAFYYFLLAPAAAISNGDPVAVTAFIALLGIGAVGLTWWLARAIGGPLAGLIAGVLLALSPAAIEESTFIWNPNPIGFFAVLALAAAWRAHVRGKVASRRVTAGWWAVAIGAAGAVTQLHLLGVVFLIAILGLSVLEARGNRGALIGIIGGLAVVGVLFLPLLAYELQNGFRETGLLLDYLRGGGGEAIGGGPVSAVAFTLLRIIGWPLMGLITDVPALAAILAVVVVAIAAFGLLRARGAEATGLRWLVGIIAWSTLALAFAAPSLQRVVPGLPNDHYHAFVDPIVVILVGVPAAGFLSRALDAWRTTRSLGTAIAIVAIAADLLALGAVTVIRMPPAVDPNGGWPAMRAAGARIAEVAAGRPVVLYGLPNFKLPDAVGYPIEYAGVPAGGAVDLMGFPDGINVIVVACDRLFESAIGHPCGGPAEDALMAKLTEMGSGPEGVPPHLVQRFDASPRTSVSIYAPLTR